MTPGADLSDIRSLWDSGSIVFVILIVGGAPKSPALFDRNVGGIPVGE
jgi:hypothetical protein